MKPGDREAGWEVSLAALRAVLSLNKQEEGGTDRRQRVGAGGRLPGQASAMQARACQPAPSLPITASGPAHSGPAHPLLGPRNSWLHIRLLLSFLQVRAQPRRRGHCTEDLGLQLHVCSKASPVLGLQGPKVTSALKRVWDILGQGERQRENMGNVASAPGRSAESTETGIKRPV